MAPSRVTGGYTQSSPSSGILFQGDGQSQNVYNAHLSSSFGNSAHSMPGTGRFNLGPVSGEINQIVLNSVANSANSIGASSLVTDANSAFSGGGPQLQRSASINTDPYMRLPASPMSFTSNNISVSGSSIADGSSTLQQNPHHDPGSQHVNQNQQHLQQGASSATSLPTGQMPISMATRFPNSFSQDPASLSQVQKKPRLDFKQDDIVQQQVIQQLLQRDPMQLQNHNPQLQAYIQQQRLRQQQQIIQAMPQMQRAQLQQQQQQLQLRQQLQQQNMQQMALMKNPHDTGGICARRLMQYLFHRRKPAENTVSYWRSFVKEYFAPRAKKRWCLSLYENVVHHAFGVFPQASMDAWHCDICGSKSGKGFEATYEVLPRLNEIKFSSGMIDELLYLDMPRERRSISGIMMLEYAKAVQESVYDQVRIIREGHLRIIFSQDLKILSWEFCARRHEELLPRRIVASQVNQFLQVAQKCQSTMDESGSEGLSSQDLQSNSNMVATAGHQLAKSLDLQSLNDLGFSKRYVRCLQIAEVVNTMKDLMDSVRDSKVGPIEGLKNYTQHATSSTSKLQLQKMQEMEQLASMQGLPTDGNNKAGVNNHMSNNNNNNNTAGMSGRAALSGPAAAALALTNYHSMLRQTSMNSHPQDSSSLYLNNSRLSPSPGPSPSFQGTNNGLLSGNIQSGPAGGYSSPQLAQQQHYSSTSQQQQPPQTSQALQQQMIQQLLHNMSNSSGPTARGPPVAGPPAAGDNMRGGGGPMLSSFKTASNSDEVSQSMHLADEMVQELTNDFTDNGFFSSSSLDDTLGYGWKA